MPFLNRFFLFFVIGLFVLCAGLWIAGGKEEKYTTSIEIDASPSQIFPYLIEPELMKQWITGLEQIDKLTPPPENPAMAPELTRLVVDEKGNEIYFKDTVIRYTPDSIVSIRSSRGGVVYTTVHQLERAERGRTRFNNFVIASYNGLGRLLAPIQSNDLEDQIVAETRRLKELVESNEEYIEVDEELETESSEETTEDNANEFGDFEDLD